MKQARSTAQKRLIFELLQNNYTHPTADDIYEQARLKDLHISRGTVYRNLGQLSQANTVLRLTMPDGPDRYDINTQHHHHFVCRQCNKVKDFQHDTNTTQNQPRDLDGFIVEQQWTVFTGLCPACAE